MIPAGRRGAPLVIGPPALFGGSATFFLRRPFYVGAALRPQPNLSKATGYSFFLRLLPPFHSFILVTGDDQGHDWGWEAHGHYHPSGH